MCDFNFVGAQYMENQDWKTKEEALLLTVGLVHKKCHRLQWFLVTMQGEMHFLNDVNILYYSRFQQQTLQILRESMIITAWISLL